MRMRHGSVSKSLITLLTHKCKTRKSIGVTEGSNVYESYDLAYKTNPTSAFGGIIAFNNKLI